MPSDKDVLIVGAGPAGLTAAVELARRGINPTVIDRKAGPSPLSRAVGILPHSMHLLTPSGVADAIRAEAIAAQEVIFHRNGFRLGRLRIERGKDPDYRLFALAQDRTEAHLREALERYGGQVTFEATLDELSEQAEQVTVLINGQSRQFSHVIGADGVDSQVRQSLGIGFDGIDLPEKWSIADVEVADWPDPKAFKAFFLRDGGAVIVVPLEETRFRVISNRPDALAALPVPMKVKNINRAGTFHISVRQASRYATDRVFLVGDAAHCHSPVGGRGMNLGIDDAVDLAARFSGGGLEGYHAARHAVGARVIRFSEDGRKTLMEGSALRRGAVQLILCIVTAMPFLHKPLVRRILEF